jgi:predicted Zn-dependent protease
VAELVDELRERIEHEYVVERDGWAAERVQRVTAKLDPAFQTLVIWHEEHTAFTAPGKTIYFGRRLLELLPDDDAAAQVIAHEIAHHKLGHLPPLTRALLIVPIRLLVGLIHRITATAQHEIDADLFAIEMCIDAGYDVDKCLVALERMREVMLDYQDIDGALGPDDGDRYARSHPPTQNRIDAVRAHAKRFREGHRLAIDLEARRKARRRTWAIAGGAAAAAVALLLIRRR